MTIDRWLLLFPAHLSPSAAMNPTDIAKQLKREADHLLFDRGYHELFSSFGEVIYTGSYKLDLLAWPDIDLQIALDENADHEILFAQLVGELAKRPDVVIVKYDKKIHLRMPQLPEGLCLSIKVKSPISDRLWKFDIWSISQAEREKNRAIMKTVEDALNENNRRLILEMKQKLITPAGRTPSLSGYHLYQAVLFRGLIDELEICDYLRTQGVVLPTTLSCFQ